MSGIVFDIQRACIHDGPGIRTTVFLKGCNLHCVWCHNPESFTFRPQLSFAAQLCRHCGACAHVCPCGVHDVQATSHIVHFDRCTTCGKCTQSCPHGALKIIGWETEAAEVITEVLKDRAYYDASGGGVTLSGGESTAQPGFFEELLTLSKDHGLHTVVETNGLFSQTAMAGVLDKIDLFLFDFKHFDAVQHQQFTGASNIRILKNLDWLHQQDRPVILRCPIIPGVNDVDQHFQMIADLMGEYENITSFEILPYHSLGASKWEEVGYTNRLATVKTVDPGRTAQWTARVKSFLATA